MIFLAWKKTRNNKNLDLILAVNVKKKKFKVNIIPYIFKLLPLSIFFFF